MKINFIYSVGRKQRITSKEELPSEFFYGYKELKNHLNKLHIYEEEELCMKLKNDFFGMRKSYTARKFL